jgi:pSer/pThr/pTyr-binding forkhead associated (FHA) protein
MSEAGVLRVTHRGHTLTFNVGEVVSIGRHPDSAVVVLHSKVSRFHAVARFEEGGWTLEDLDSSNGTFLAGEQLETLALAGPVKVNVGAIDGPSLTLVPEVLGDTAVASDETLRIDAGPVQPTGSQTQRIGPGPGHHSRRSPTVTRIGRSPDNDLVLDDEGVSWFHAELRVSAEGSELVDLNSHNGTFVNGRQIDRADLTDLDLVAVADFPFRFVGDRLEPLNRSG